MEQVSKNLRLICLETKSDLLGFSANVHQLFNDCFHRSLDSTLWEWAYLKNPYGSPIVALAFDKDELVGHYALIPIVLVNKVNETINAYLSMTTMIKKLYLRLDLFRVLAEITYEVAFRKNKSPLVYGYPNNKSAPGFSKRLAWKVNSNLSIYGTDTKHLSSDTDFQLLLADAEAFTINLSDENALKWRSNKPNSIWIENEGAFFKRYNQTYDLMYISDRDLFMRKCKLPFNILGRKQDLCQSTGYIAGQKQYNNDYQVKLFHQMSMSDIF